MAKIEQLIDIIGDGNRQPVRDALIARFRIFSETRLK
jgi:hypothetical protein